MRDGIHPEYYQWQTVNLATAVTHLFTGFLPNLISNVEILFLSVISFYTGQQQVAAARADRIDKFNRKYGISQIMIAKSKVEG